MFDLSGGVAFASFLFFSLLFRLWYNGILVYVLCFLLFFFSAVEKGT